MENSSTFSSMRFSMLFFAIFFTAMLSGDEVTATEGIEASFPPPPPHDLQEHSFFSQTALLPPILSHLGFHELATAAPSLSDAATTTSPAWTGPFTIFAPSDASLRTCFSCSVPNLLREHIVPGIFTIEYLRRLAFGTKIETLSPGRCVTVTSESIHQNNTSGSAPKVFIGGVEITQPDLFNNGMVVVHGLQGFASKLSPFSCDVERMSSLSFPFHPDHRSGAHVHTPGATVLPAIMRLMLRDAMVRLRNNGFSILSLAMKVKYAELITLNNMTIFAVDDLSIFSGSQSYISNVRFHIIPNHYLSIADLEKLPVGTALPTLERGQPLLITTSGGGVTSAPMRINYVRVKVADVIRNVKIVVHSVYLPFPHINPIAAAYDTILGGEGASEGAGVGARAATVSDSAGQATEETCSAPDGRGGCAADVTTAAGVSPMPQVKPMVEIEDHHGL
ncbi:putative FAS1 domain-containing protein [Medicago truncatula]|uniref:Fasciclin-like arabinogalactan protein n=1 Tax=Medicago truncatula TaxID=3880 RepID=G7LAE6_MEDTR|nr:fasciclin-like arabinogalactan protein [Medicago truncatula]RHN42965.1 putative FAS1 domain-containing protein [Medicago truncatula]